MSANHEQPRLTPEETNFIRRVATHYAPPPMTSAQRAAFDRALEKRLSRNAYASFFRPVTVVAAACAAVLVWFGITHHGISILDKGSPSATTTVVTETTQEGEEKTTLLMYTYYEAEFEDDDNGEDEQFLPDEYEACWRMAGFYREWISHGVLSQTTPRRLRMPLQRQ